MIPGVSPSPSQRIFDMDLNDKTFADMILIERSLICFISCLRAFPCPLTHNYYTM